MKALWKLYRDCVLELQSINMDISDRIVSVTVNGRLRTVLGKCKYNRRTKCYSIEINDCVLADNADEQAAKEVIVHELLHTCPGAFNHGYEWKLRGEKANRLLGYDVCRLRDISTLEAQGVEVKQETYKYALVCDDCGNQYKRKRWSNALKYPELYHCGRCNGNLRTICLDESVAICKPVWAANKVK